MRFNPLYKIDAYKLDHRRQYPDGTTEVLSNFTPRNSRIESIDKVVFFGLQAFLDDLAQSFQYDFFERDVDEVCREYEQNALEILGPNDIGSDHFRALHKLGYLPLEIRALPEGTKVPLRVPMFTVRNTVDEFAWLVNYFETLVSAEVWLPCTSATTANHLRELLVDWAEKTGTPLDAVNFQAHDFSYRGMTSTDSAAASGAGHLLSFLGSDTLPAKEWAKWHYDAKEPILLSVAATEHSVMCAGGAGQDEEFETYQRLLNLYPVGILSVVSDTWDLWNVITNYLPRLKDQIMGRDGKLVIRPDSGDPADILCGLNTHPDFLRNESPVTGSPEELGVIELLWEIFGGTINEKGFKVLDPHIGAIYGDSITYDRADDICRRLAAKGFASGNVVFGTGSFSYQGAYVEKGKLAVITRDLFGFAMKATNAVVNGVNKAIFKDPITDDGTKKSARGRIAVSYDPVKGFELKDELSQEELDWLDDINNNWLVPVWVDGVFVRRYSFDQVKKNMRYALPQVAVHQSLLVD